MVTGVSTFIGVWFVEFLSLGDKIFTVLPDSQKLTVPLVSTCTITLNRFYRVGKLIFGTARFKFSGKCFEHFFKFHSKLSTTFLQTVFEFHSRTPKDLFTISTNFISNTPKIYSNTHNFRKFSLKFFQNFILDQKSDKNIPVS